MYTQQHARLIGLVLAAAMMCFADEPRANAEPQHRASGLADLFQTSDAESYRVSSADPDWQHGNGDCRPIPPGETLTIAQIDGPGIIRHIWFTVAAHDPQYGRSLVLRMYWDGHAEPAVESPLGDFFAVGLGEQRTVNSMPVAVSSEGKAYNCYWPMPFAKHARIILTNDSTEHPVACLFWYVDYERVPDLPANTAYFHAQYRQEYPARPGNYLILDTEGKGHYVGTVLSARQRTAGWFGEGDDFFYIDGEKEPRLRGTGTEDYFCDAWGFREFNHPYYGVVIYDGFIFGGRVSAYRWHIQDPVHFRKSLRVEIEHKGSMANEKGEFFTGFGERADLFSSVAYWYQKGPAKRFATVPPLAERTTAATRIELEQFMDHVAVTPADSVYLNQQAPTWSGGGQILATFQAPDATFTVTFKLDRAAEGIGKLRLTHSYDYGIWRVSLDGKILPGMDRLDLYNPSVAVEDHTLGHLALSPGPHTLKFECLGQNPKSAGVYLGVDALTVDELTRYTVKSGEAQ